MGWGGGRGLLGWEAGLQFHTWSFLWAFSKGSNVTGRVISTLLQSVSVFMWVNMREKGREGGKERRGRLATQLYVIEPQQNLWVQVSQAGKTLQSYTWPKESSTAGDIADKTPRSFGLVPSRLSTYLLFLAYDSFYSFSEINSKQEPNVCSDLCLSI